MFVLYCSAVDYCSFILFRIILVTNVSSRSVAARLFGYHLIDFRLFDYRLLVKCIPVASTMV
jgi:hypothetical protein